MDPVIAPTPEQEVEAALGLTPEATPVEEKDDKYSALQDEVRQLREAMLEGRRSQFVGPEGDRPQPVAQPQQGTQFTPRKLDTKRWAELAERDPHLATREIMNAELGLPEGSNPFGIFNVMAEKLKTVEEANKLTSQELMNSRIEAEATKFMNNTPEYEGTEQNFKVLDNYRQRYQLPVTAQGWDLAFTKAIADGALTAAEAEKPTRGQKQRVSNDDEGEYGESAPAPTRTRVPSLRNRGTTQPEQEFASIVPKLDQMTPEAVREYISRISGGR